MASAEDHAYEFIEAAIEAAVEGEPLFAAELHDTVYRPIKKKFGVRVGDGEGILSPGPGGEEMEEFDVVIPIVIYSLVEGPDRTDRKAARSRMIDLAKAVAKLFYDDPTMGERVNDARMPRFPRGWDSWDSSPYAVANMTLLVNETERELP